jgi:flagellar motor switch protein FliM
MSKNRLSPDEIRSLLQGSESGEPLDASRNAAGENTTVETADDGDRAGIGGVCDLEASSAWTRLEHLADHVRIALSEHLRAPIQVALTGAERISRRDFMASRVQPGFLGTSTRVGGEQEIALDVELSFLLPAINRMLGGSLQDAPIPPHQLTRIETGLANRLADRIVGALFAGFGETQPGQWASVAPVEGSESGLAECGHALVAALDLTVGLGPASGRVRIAFPWELFQQAADALVKTGVDGVNISVILAKTSVPLSTLADLQPGDLVASHLALDELCEVFVDGQTRFRARLGALEGRKAVRIEQVEGS